MEEAKHWRNLGIPVQVVTYWMTPIFSYIKDGRLPSDPKKAKKMKIIAT